MCTLITYWQCQGAAPLLMAVNRDEFLQRPTASPALWRPGGSATDVLSGRDLKSGGTWFGVGREVVAGLTNHRAGLRSLPGRFSRGELVVRALLSADLRALEAELRRLPLEAYGPFHLLAADQTDMAWCTNRDRELEVHRVSPGLHVLGNHGLDNPEDPVVRHVHSVLQPTLELSQDALIPRLQAILAEHGPHGPCVHRGGDYGTRSAAILIRGGAQDRFLVTEGPSCRAPWDDRSALLQRLAA